MIFRWLKKLGERLELCRDAASRRHPCRVARPWVERLEDRLVPSKIGPGPLLWTQQSSLASVNGVSADSSGVYVGGSAVTFAEPGAMVLKYDPAGQLLWSQVFGDEINGVYANGAGVYVAGAADLPLPGYPNDITVVAILDKFDANGNEIWERQLGSSPAVGATGACANGSTVYVAGDISGGALAGQTSLGADDAWVRSYDADGNLLWSRQFGTSANDYAYGVSADASGVYVAGVTDGTFPGQTSEPGGTFLVKYDTAGNLLWTRQFGAGLGAIAVLPGQASAGGQDAFVVKYDAKGNPLWTSQFGSAADEYANGVYADGSGAYIVGSTFGTLKGQTSAGGEDAYVLGYDATGNLLWTRQFGTAADEEAEAVTADSSGVYVAGQLAGYGHHPFLVKFRIANDAPPVAGSVTLSSSDPGGAVTTASVLTADVTTGSDADGETVGYIYQWYANGTAIVGATAATFTLNSAAFHRGDTITVTVTPCDASARGMPVSAGVTISADAPARVTSNPGSVTVAEHGQAVFSAASSNPTAALQWQVGINGKGFRNLPGATADTLTLADVLRKQNGDQYRAIFTNTAGTSITQAATLTVLFVTGPFDRTVDAGQSATFSASYSGPKSAIQWQYSQDGGRLYSNLPGATHSTVILSNVTTNDNGLRVRAVFTNNAGTVDSAAAVLHVNAFPSIANLSVNRGTVGTSLRATMAIAGGGASFRISDFTIGGYKTLPQGFSKPLITEVSVPTLDGSSKEEALLTIDFTPQKPGTYHGRITLTDKAVVSITRSFTITIAPKNATGQTLVALTKDGRLLTFSSAAPGTISESVAVVGLAKGDTLQAIAFDPNGTLYGVSFMHLYRLDLTTGAATLASGPNLNLYSADGGLAASFDPVTSQLRVIDDIGDNDVIDLVRGTVDSFESPVFVQGDVNHNSGCFLSAIAYTDEFAGATSATLYGEDVNPGPTLVTIGGPDGNPSPNSGAAHTVAATQPISAFTIGGANNTAYAIGPERTSQGPALWTVDLTTGAERRVGHFGSAAPIASLAAMPGA